MFSDPLKNLKQLGLHENMIVADLGAGTGFYSIAAAHMVPHGKVYAIEVVKDYLTTVRHKAIALNLHNLECIWGNIEKVGGTKIKDGIVDVIIVSNVLSHVDHKDKFLAEIKRILKTGGKILFIDWTNWISMVSSNHKKTISKEIAKELFEKNGFAIERDIDAGEHHYGMILKRK